MICPTNWFELNESLDYRLKSDARLGSEAFSSYLFRRSSFRYFLIMTDKKLIKMIYSILFGHFDLSKIRRKTGQTGIGLTHSDKRDYLDAEKTIKFRTFSRQYVVFSWLFRYFTFFNSSWFKLIKLNPEIDFPLCIFIWWLKFFRN